MFAPQFIEHRGQRILRLDFVGLSEPELLEAFAKVAAVVRAAPPRSLLVLGRHDSGLTRRTAEALKQLAFGNGPHVHASAIYGSPFWKVIVADLQAHGRENMMLFDDESSALDWLAAQ